MLLDQAALCEQAAMLESMELKVCKFDPAFLSKLETLLLEVYASLLPSDIEYEQRKKLVQLFNKTAKDIFGDTGGFPEVVAFGSFIMNLFTTKSDLDLSINFNSSNAACLPRNKVINILRRFAKVLRKKQSNGLLSRVSQIPHARVPVLKAVDSETGIECDISIENKNGISRSLFFSTISSIDERFRIMSYLMKAWAKANGINSSKDHTMNSLSIISLVALHFQTRDPPILPPFSALLRDGTDITNLSNVVLEFSNFARRNTESVAELFVSLLVKLTSVEKLWELGLCACNFEGSWISKTWSSKFGSNMNVEDFLDRTQNFARTVGKSKMPKIYNCLRGSLGYLSSSMQGLIEESALRTLLFEPVSNHTIATTNAAMITHQKFSNYIQPHVDTINSGNCTNRAAEKSLERNPISNKFGQHHANTNPVLIKNQKLPNKSIHPHVDILSQSNHVTTTSGMSRKRKKKYTKSKQHRVNTIPLTNPSHINMGMTRNPKHPRIEVIEPRVNSIALAPKLPSQALPNIIEPKLSVQHHVESNASKWPLLPNATGDLPQSYICHPNPMISPGLPYIPPQYGIIHSNISGHWHPLAANTGHHQSYQQIQYPFANDLASASQYRPFMQCEQMVPVSSSLIQYFPNPWHPMILDSRHPNMLPDYAMHKNNMTGHPQFIPSRSFGPNHP